MNPIIVIFRKWPNGNILALFPFEIHNGNLCMSYEHVGQHGGADYNSCIDRTKPATLKEYRLLKKELELLGYTLIIRKKKGKNNLPKPFAKGDIVRINHPQQKTTGVINRVDSHTGMVSVFPKDCDIGIWYISRYLKRIGRVKNV